MNASTLSLRNHASFEAELSAFTLALIQKGRVFAAAAGGAVMICGALVWVGWWAEWDFLKRFVPGAVSMNPLTALCFILAGYALRARAREGHFSKYTTAVTLILAVVGFGRLICYALGLHFGLDQWFFTEALHRDVPGQVNQMAPNTALNFLLYALVMLSPRDMGILRGKLSEAALLLMLFSALLAVLGYAYAVQWMYGVAAFIPMALPTALLFSLLAVGNLMSQPSFGLTELFYSPSAGGKLARRLFPALIFTFMLIGWLRLQGQRQGLLDTDTSVTFYTFFTIFILGGLVWWSARSLHLAEVQKRHTEAELDHFFELSLDILAIATLEGRWRRVNRAFTQALGYASEELLHSSFQELLHPEDQARFEQELVRLKSGQALMVLETRFRHQDGSWRWLSWKALPVPAEALLYCTGRDVTEEKAAASKLRAVNEELVQKTGMLEQANHELEAFSYSVSHDLRAPLRAICGFTQALQDHSSSTLDATSLGYLQRVRLAGDRMSGLIDDLLALSRLTRAEMRLQGVEMSTLAEEVLAELRERDPERQVETVVEPGLVAWGDPALLRILLENLLGNAWKFSARTASARIEFSAHEQADGGKAFCVRDNGVGFDMRYVHKLFGAFQRLHSQSEFPGTGIGLAIVQRIAVRHGGRVWCEAQPGQGAVFFFTL